MTETNTISEKELKKYLRRIKGALVCNFKTKRKILKDLKNNVEEYLEQNPDSSLEDLMEYFGKPESIAEEFAVSAGIDYIKKTKVHKMIKLIVIILLILALVFTIITSIVIITNNKRTAVYYYEESVEDLGIIE